MLPPKGKGNYAKQRGEKKIKKKKKINYTGVKGQNLGYR